MSCTRHSRHSGHSAIMGACELTAEDGELGALVQVRRRGQPARVDERDHRLVGEADAELAVMANSPVGRVRLVQTRGDPRRVVLDAVDPRDGHERRVLGEIAPHERHGHRVHEALRAQVELLGHGHAFRRREGLAGPFPHRAWLHRGLRPDVPREVRKADRRDTSRPSSVVYPSVATSGCMRCAWSAITMPMLSTAAASARALPSRGRRKTSGTIETSEQSVPAGSRTTRVSRRCPAVWFQILWAAETPTS